MNETEQRQRESVIAEALTWEKTPFHSMARVKGAGVDCAQFLIVVYATVGLIEDFDPGYYPADWALHKDEERYLGWVEKLAKPVDAPLPADIAVWKFGRTFSHAAIVVDWPKIIHAQIGVGVTLGEGNAAWLVNQIKGEPRPVRFYSLWAR